MIGRVSDPIDAGVGNVFLGISLPNFLVDRASSVTVETGPEREWPDPASMLKVGGTADIDHENVVSEPISRPIRPVLTVHPTTLLGRRTDAIDPTRLSPNSSFRSAPTMWPA
jgi:hypothetical protein